MPIRNFPSFNFRSVSCHTGKGPGRLPTNDPHHNPDFVLENGFRNDVRHIQRLQSLPAWRATYAHSLRSGKFLPPPPDPPKAKP